MQSKEKANFVHVLDFSLTFPMFKTICFDRIIMNCLRKLGALRHNGEVFLLRSSKNLSNVMNVDYFLLLRLVKMKFTHGYRAACYTFFLLQIFCKNCNLCAPSKAKEFALRKTYFVSWQRRRVIPHFFKTPLWFLN